MRLSKDQRQHVADKGMDGANIILAALVVGQFVERSVPWPLVLAGLLFYGVIVVFTTWLRKGG